MSAQDAKAGASSPTTVTLARAGSFPGSRTSPWRCPPGSSPTSTRPPNALRGCGGRVVSGELSHCDRHDSGWGRRLPLTLTGRDVPRAPPSGAVAGASLVVRAKIGDLDLGDVVVPARIELRPTDAGLTLSTTAPTRFRNLPFCCGRWRSPSIGQLPVEPDGLRSAHRLGHPGSDQGQTATPSTQISYTGCGDLAVCSVTLGHAHGRDGGGRAPPH